MFRQIRTRFTFRCFPAEVGTGFYQLGRLHQSAQNEIRLEEDLHKAVANCNADRGFRNKKGDLAKVAQLF